MPTPTIIETDLREILAEMNKKLDTMSADINRTLEVLSGESKSSASQIGYCRNQS